MSVVHMTKTLGGVGTIQTTQATNQISFPSGLLGWLPIQVHEEDSKNKVASDHLPSTNPGKHRVNRTSDEIRRRKWNWIGHIMKKDREEH